MTVRAPSVIVPHMVDQPYWGQRVHVLGVGPKPVPRHKLTAVKLTHAINDQSRKQRAANLGAHIQAENGRQQAVNIIQEIIVRN